VSTRALAPQVHRCENLECRINSVGQLHSGHYLKACERKVKPLKTPLKLQSRKEAKANKESSEKCLINPLFAMAFSAETLSLRD